MQPVVKRWPHAARFKAMRIFDQAPAGIRHQFGEIWQNPFVPPVLEKLEIEGVETYNDYFFLCHSMFNHIFREEYAKSNYCTIRGVDLD